MNDFGVVEDEQIDWNLIIDNLPDALNFEFLDEPVREFSNPLNPSPDSGSLSIEDIEQLLMNDDSNVALPDHEQVSADGFLTDVLLDSPAASDLSDELIDGPEKDSSSPLSSEEDKDKDAHDSQAEALEKQNDDDHVVDDDDPTAKKRKRQMRNRDAALRSRERKKMYVKDLEMKSRYFEAECKRLGMLLNSCLAENQALRLSLHNSKAVDASMTKQESAVLLLESLLLGSLLGFLGIICLLILPSQFQLSLVAVLLEDVETKGKGNLTRRGEVSKIFRTLEFQSSVMGRRCKASRARMKPRLSVPRVVF
ncbi:bZIP transcription factor 60-like [Olea europaea var. sylvestris]|uniref:bZIP transcription factor 60-like n=1 Tax=Olea europaea var. sylvestris TaxID=158386 RepID=UPI000C1D52E4|nr:bZIP transcription factor 60-like [Olea europaea var. sylvestris]